MNMVEKLQGILAADAASLALGIEVQSASVQQVVLSLEVTREMTNGYQVCHGGVIFSLADTALAFACVAID
ncbi:MAG: hotdog fold thioesterase, partial [Pseudomonadales bacterium]|nr:hotdog fold thioesterase [Pseudomonadales bacterium]